MKTTNYTQKDGKYYRTTTVSTEIFLDKETELLKAQIADMKSINKVDYTEVIKEAEANLEVITGFTTPPSVKTKKKAKK